MEKEVESSSWPLEFVAYICLSSLCLSVFSIFIDGFDLDFSKFGIISDDDFLGMSSCRIEFHLCKV